MKEYNIREFINENKLDYSVEKIFYKGCHKKIILKHSCGYTYETTQQAFIKLGRRCPKCQGGAKQTLDELKQKVYNLKGDEYTIISDTYRNAQTKILFRHNSCGRTFEMRPKDFLKPNGNRCPKCRSSRGELKSSQWFTNHNINFEHKYKDETCKNDLILEFDFKVYKNDGTFVLYEFDGRLHFEPWDDTEKSKEHLLKQQENDEIKNKFCEENKITLIRINYKENLEEKLNEYFNLNDYRKDNLEIDEY